MRFVVNSGVNKRKNIGPKDSIGKKVRSYFPGKLYLKGILLIGQT